MTIRRAPSRKKAVEDWMRILLVVPMLCLMASCAASRASVREVAGLELSCPDGSLQVKEHGDTAHVQGCNQDAGYVRTETGWRRVRPPSIPGAVRERVESRAASGLRCPSASLVLEGENAAAVVAHGCGRRERYLLCEDEVVAERELVDPLPEATAKGQPKVPDFDRAQLEPPVLLEGRDPPYTPEALAERVRGLMVIRCVLTVEGRLEQCRFLKGLPHLEEAALQAMASRRYKPAGWKGEPVAIDYTLNLCIKNPALKPPPPGSFPSPPTRL
jgi:hypothetical protein